MNRIKKFKDDYTRTDAKRRASKKKTKQASKLDPNKGRKKTIRQYLNEEE